MSIPISSVGSPGRAVCTAENALASLVLRSPSGWVTTSNPRFQPVGSPPQARTRLGTRLALTAASVSDRAAAASAAACSGLNRVCRRVLTRPGRGSLASTTMVWARSEIMAAASPRHRAFDGRPPTGGRAPCRTLSDPLHLPGEMRPWLRRSLRCRRMSAGFWSRRGRRHDGRGAAPPTPAAAGYETNWASDGGRRNQLWQREYPDGVVILDLMLPGMSGLELLRRRRSQADHAAVIILSARGEEEGPPGRAGDGSRRLRRQAILTA